MQAFKSICGVATLQSRAFRVDGVAALLMALAVGGMVMPLAAEASGETKLTVSATVSKHASLQVLTQPVSVVITAVDMARGYVDALSPTQVTVQSNTQDGYLLMFDNQGDFLRHALVKGLDSDVQVSGSGGGVAQRSTGGGMHKNLLHLGFRFILSDSARQGVYAWPIRLSVTPL